jgi:predicted negative regulator of RcsB-dependent stress response
MSSQRLSRKEIKHDVRDDAFRHAVEGGYDYVRGHQRNLILVIASIVVLVAGYGGWRTWRAKREAGASDLLGHAIASYDAPVVPSGAKPDDPIEPSFADDASRLARAKAQLEQLERDYSGTGAASVGKIYMGHIRLQEKDPAGARKLWQEFLDERPDDLLASAVRVSMLDLDRKQGKGNEIVQKLRADLEKDDKPLPEDVMLYQLGVTLEQLGRGQEAKDAYQRVVDEYPDSPWASKSTMKVRELTTAGPA